MAIGDPFGSLDASPDDDWQEREAQSNLAALETARPKPRRSLYDTANDVAHMPGRVLGSLTASPASPEADQAAMMPETFVNPMVKNAADAVGGALSSGATAPGDALSGKIPMWDNEGHTSPEAIQRGFDTAAMAGGGSVAGATEHAVPGADARILGIRVHPAELASDTAKPGAAIAAAEHAPPFYSGLEHAVAEIPQERMTGSQWLGTLQNRPGVKPEELDWTGARDMLAAKSDQPVTKAELQDHLDANKVQLGEVTKAEMPTNWKDVPPHLQSKIADRFRDITDETAHPSDLPDWYESVAAHSHDAGETALDKIMGPPRYAGYQLSGGENYREKLLTLPAKGLSAEDVIRRDGSLNAANKGDVAPTYTSTHWDEPNVLAHLRMNERDVAGAPSPEYQAAVDASKAHQAKIDDVVAQQGAVGKQITHAAGPLNAARSTELMAKARANKMTAGEYNRALEQGFDHPELKPLQDKLQALRAQEDELRKAAPPAPAPNTKPALHLEEIQSDWHQQGRQGGYKSDAMKVLQAEADARKAFRAGVKSDMPDEQLDVLRQQLVDAQRNSMKFQTVVPDAPFKKNWHELALKRALHEAAETGKDRISWTPGAAHPTNPKNLGRRGEEADAADRGMQGFYDKMIPDAMNKIGKPHGVQVKKGTTSGRPAYTGSGPTEPVYHSAEVHPVHYMDIPPSLRQALLTKGMPLFEDSSAGAAVAAADHLPQGAENVARAANAAGEAGAGGGDPGLAKAQAAAARIAGTVQPLAGLPTKPLILNGEHYVPGPIGSVHDVAKRYMESTGRPYQRLERYHPIDPEHATAIAKAYEEMPHAPNDPKVKASYDAMIKETAAQYQALKKSGLKIEAIKPGQADPYAQNPRLAAKDVAENNHLWYFPTEGGFGTDAATGGAAAAQAGGEHPMLQKTGVKLGGRELLANDMFRIVHDYFGHLKEGNGFRAAGEDNAYRTHSKMYSDLARPAMTTETRGQNSWLNYGPHGEFNRTASAADTHYAEQKVGVMPPWTMEDRAHPLAHVTTNPNDVPFAGAKYPHYAEEYPPVGAPRLMDKATGKPIEGKTAKASQKLVDQGKTYWGKQNTPEAEAFQKDRSAIQKDMEKTGYEPFFDPAERAHVDPANHPTPLDMTRDALPAKQATIDKYHEMFSTPEAHERLQKAFDVGKTVNGADNWYAMRQLEDQYVKHLGPEEGRARFAREFAHTMAATTGGADPTSNLLLAHYVQWAAKNKGSIPEASHQHPFPIGGRYVSGNIDQFRKMPEGGFTADNPKRHDFGHAFLGHPDKATIDEQMSGGLVPGMAIPPGDSYGVAAKVVHALAAHNGVHPRDFQDVAWAGLKKLKTEEAGKKFGYQGPMIQHVNDAIERTHRLTGMPRNDIVKRGLVKKEIPLYAGGPAVPFGALDAEQEK